MLDHAFQRRREIERMLLSGKRLTVPKLMAMYSVGKNAIRRDFEVIGEELPVIAKQGYNGGYSLMDVYRRGFSRLISAFSILLRRRMGVSVPSASTT